MPSFTNLPLKIPSHLPPCLPPHLLPLLPPPLPPWPATRNPLLRLSLPRNQPRQSLFHFLPFRNRSIPYRLWVNRPRRKRRGKRVSILWWETRERGRYVSWSVILRAKCAGENCASVNDFVDWTG